MTPVDVFVDLSASDVSCSGLHAAILNWARPENLGAMARRVTGVVAPGILGDGSRPLPSGWVFSESASPAPGLSGALASAGCDDVPLLLLLGLVDVNSDVVGVLRQCLDRDPMFGFAVPRVGCADRCCFARLSPHGVGTTQWLPRKILADLPDDEVFVEVVAPCMLIAPQVLGNFELLPRQFDNVAAAMLHYMAGARRCGFRTILSNRAVAGMDGLTCGDGVARFLPDLSPQDQTMLHQLVPDFDQSWQEFRAGSWERFERLCTSSIEQPKGATRPSLLLDVRNVGAIYNGTSQAILGTLNAFKELQPKWDITILASPQGAVFHDLERIYAGWPVYTRLPDRSFTAALRPSQPWHIQEMVDLHRVSLFNAYLVLDSIAWDIAYSAPSHLEGTWQFLAGHADAFLYDSDFSRRRFVERFPAAGSVPGVVTHFSFDPSEYIRTVAVGGSSDDTFILVVGNNLDHKDVRHTVEALASGFPFRRIRALGPAHAVSPLVTAHHSGELPDLELHRLYAGAQYVVFPSFYEGFGFPILTALAYGRTVLARRSVLLDEVAAQCAPRGRLVVFDRREELVELIGRLGHGEPVPEYPLGRGVVNGRLRRWRDVAQDILTFLEPLLRQPSHSRWIAREHAVKQLLAYRT